MIKKITRNKVLLSFLLSTLLGILIILPNIIVGGGLYYLVDDFNLQQIPFNIINNHLIKDGNFIFSWFNDFGSSLIPTYSFYNLFSPFNIIGYLFPAKMFPYLIGPIFILKYGSSGVFSYLFLKRYVKNKNYAVLGSLFYTFSGFQLTNMLFYHFHDVVCFFPLLLYTLDNLVYDNKRGRFLLAVFLCSITNWFFFIEEVIFLIIYYIIKVLTHEYKFTFKSFFSIIIEGFLGTLMSMFILLPTYLFTSGNTRVVHNWSFSKALKYPSIWYMELIRAYILPSQTMTLGKRAMLLKSNYSSIDLYLPLVGSVFTLSYGLHNLKKSTTIISLTSMIIMFIPIFNSSFLLFNSTLYYYRWFFMLILIMSLMSVKCIENNESIKLSSVLISLTIIIFTILLIIKRDTLINISLYTFVMIIISILSIFVCNYIFNKYSRKRLKYFIIFTCLYIVFYGNFITFQYKYKNYWDNNNYKKYIKYNKGFNKISESRSNSSFSCPSNLSNTKRIHNIRSFNSNILSSVFSFIDSVSDEKRYVSTIIPIDNKELNDFLGVKYIVGCSNDDVSVYGYKYYTNIEDYKIYINDEYKEFGSSYNNFISKDEYYSKDMIDRIHSLNNSIVLDSKQIKEYGYLFPNEVWYDENKFKFLGDGFSSYIVSSGDTMALYQIPYDLGWKATINGKNVKIENIDQGFIGIKINKGKNNIVFKYVVPGLKIGVIISIVSLFLSLIYIICFWKCKA